MILAAGSASANPLDDAKAGMKAFDRGDNSTAVRMFTAAIDSGRLMRSDQELAFVKRSEARIAMGQGQAALADANSALNLDPSDGEAIAARDHAQAMLAPAPRQFGGATNEPTFNQKAEAAYQEALKRYEEQKKADAKRYEEQLNKYNEELRAAKASREAQLAAWQADVRACQAGVVSKCATPPPPAVTKPAPPPVAQTVATPAPKPAPKPVARKPAARTAAAPPERPPIY